jgi:hypothetical protein
MDRELAEGWRVTEPVVVADEWLVSEQRLSSISSKQSACIDQFVVSQLQIS